MKADVKTYSVASQAMPTSDPVGHPLIKCHKPILSLPFVPRHCENIERRLSSSALEQLTFHGAVVSTTDGQLNIKHQGCAGSGEQTDSRFTLNLEFGDTEADIKTCLEIFEKGKITLDGDGPTLYNALAEFQLFNICCVAFSWPP